MTCWVYLGIVLFALGLFTWLFAASKLKGYQNSFVPASPGRLRLFQFIMWTGIVFFIGGIALAIFTLK